MSTMSRTDKHAQSETSEGTPRPRGGKLARRARSFKEDFLDILAQMRSPTGPRAGSPKPTGRSPKHRTTSSSEPPPDTERNPLRDLDFHVRQVQFALKHFRDVVSRNKLEVLPGNGTVVLETITTIHGVLKSYVFIDQSSTLVSATNQVYQSLAKLIKLCDDVLLIGEKALNKENVTEVVQLVEDAVQNLVTLASAKISEQNNKSLNHNSKPAILDRSSTYSAEPVQRSSLPDIPLTPRERQILEQTSQSVIQRHGHHSLSSESILHDDTPPPKPPLPNRSWCSESPPPPLPPKRRQAGPPSLSLERLSLRSEDTSSLGSLDSMLNASLKDDDELRALIDEDGSVTNDSVQHSHGSALNGSSGSCCCWDSSCSTISQVEVPARDSPEIVPSTAGTVERTSTSSGFISMRSSSQSYNYSSSKSSSVCLTETKQQTITVTSTSIQQKSSHTTVSVSSSSSPPALPVKQRSRRERHPSQYDNVPSDSVTATTTAAITTSTATTSASGSSSSPTRPPPLPLKKKHIMAYMEMFGNCSQPSTNEYLRHSVHTYSLLQAEWQQHEMTLSSAQSCSFNMVSHSSASSDIRNISPSAILEKGALPPALPPKRSRHRSSATSPPPPSPTPPTTHTPTPETPTSRDRDEVPSPRRPTVHRLELPLSPPVTNGTAEKETEITVPPPESPLDLLEISRYLVLKKPDEEGPDIRGGHPDALIIHATKANKNDFLYQEAFLTTYRTFLTPLDLIEKLCRRHERFSCASDTAKQRAAREAFSLLVRVVSDLTMSDLEATVLQTLMDFVYQLLCSGDLTMAKALRVKILEKHNTKRLQNASNMLLPSQNVYTRQSSLLDFKSEHIAEQMTLLDSELFMKIEIPEVLIWAQEQNEERSPNLTRFTEHFNKMSYWARSRILEQPDAKDRERYVVKFIKIMKHLRKINNFNSYLALLSALDSAPIRRLEWQKHITEGLKEYCALIDSSSSFRAYRQALADTQPPCIPYIGLVLQDLTFVHIGNSDILSDGIINFSKRWQQFNIVENMKRFKKGTYSFKKSERIIAFFSNFDEFLCEEAMWQISESIKPRGSKKTVS